MNLLKKAAVAVAAISMVAAPVAASAAPQSDLRADTVVEGNSFGAGGGGNWLLILFAVGLVGLGAVSLADGSDDTPTSV